MIKLKNVLKYLEMLLCKVNNIQSTEIYFWNWNKIIFN